MHRSLTEGSLASAAGARPRDMRWHDYITVNLFWLGLNIRNTALGSVFMPYLVDIFAPQDVKNTALGMMGNAGLIVAMLVQPAAGLLSDRSTSRFGRRRPFIFVGVLFDLVFLAAVGLAWNYWSLVVAVLLLQLSSNVSHGPLQGLIPDLVPEEKRGRASAIKAIFELIPIILVALTVARLVSGGRLAWSIVLTGAVLLATMVLTVLLVREAPLRVRPDTPLGPPMKRVIGMVGGLLAGGGVGLLAGGLAGGVLGLIAWPLLGGPAARAVGVAAGGLLAMVVAVGAGVWAGVRATLGHEAQQHASFTWWIVNRLLYLAAITSLQRSAPYFLMSAFGLSREEGTGLNAALMGVIGGFILVAALPSGWLSDRFGHRRLVSASGVIAAAGTCLLLLALGVRSLPLTYIAGCVVGLGAGPFMTSNWALGTSLVPAAEAGRYLGISNLAGAGAGLIGAGIGGPMADLINQYRPGLGYFVIYGCYAVLFLLSTLSLRGVRGANR